MDNSNKYLSYLMRKVFYRDEYSKLIEHLFLSKFIVVYDQDNNRVSNALSKRNLSNFSQYMPPFKECSMLELIVEISMEVENILYDPKYGYRGSQWFWEMIGNLGLLNQTNNNFDSTVVDNVIEAFCNHKYKKNGSGSLFKTYNKTIDMRTMSIWEQMQVYMNEMCH